MKKFLFLIGMISISLLSQQIVAQGAKTKEDRNFRIPLIGEQAPAFVANSTKGEINFPSDYGSSWKILLSHPQDFTPVCSSEIIELGYLADTFKKMNVKIVVVSTDELEKHKLWKSELEKVKMDDREPAKINFPLVDDKSIAISKLYGMIHPESNTTKNVRGVFIVNPKNVIEAIFFYPMQVGRNMNELVRTVEALQLSYNVSLLTPANWEPGKDLLVPSNPEIDNPNVDVASLGYYNPVWFMWYKKAGTK